MADKLKVFVSSSMRELRSEREAVKAVLEADNRIEAWVYEDDVEARDQSIQETYLQRLRQAHGYVGIFWKKYGEYTIDEFDRAHEAGKHKMVFVKEVADDSERDPELRDFFARAFHVQTGVATPVWFKDAEDLADKIERAVDQWVVDAITRRSQNALPPLLVDRCDRKHQQLEITDAALSEAGVGPPVSAADGARHPVVCLIDGHEDERHRPFVKVVAKRVIPEALDPATTSVKDKSVDWPSAKKYDDFRKEMLFSLSHRFLGRRVFDVDAIAGELDRHLGPVLVSTFVHQSEIEADPRGLIGNYVRFWNEWPARSEGLLFAFLCIQYPDPPTGRLRRLLGGGKATDRVREAARSIVSGPGDGSPWDHVTVYATSELDPVDRGDAEEWAELEEVTRYVGSPDLAVRIQDRIRESYDGFRQADRLVEDRVRMGTLAPALESILKDVRSKEM